MRTTYRVITWTNSAGVRSVSDFMSHGEANVLADVLRGANPDWLNVSIESVDEDTGKVTKSVMA